MGNSTSRSMSRSMSNSRYYHTVLRNSSISHLKYLYNTHLVAGEGTKAAYCVLAMCRMIGPAPTARVLGPYLQTRTMLQLVWLDASRTQLPAFLYHKTS